ncbi:MAG: peptidoglycan-binding protein [Phycisphaerae bacterium]
MSFMPKDPTGGLRKQRAAQIKAETDAKKSQEASPQGEATSESTDGSWHTVREGESLEDIAQQYNQSPQAIWDDEQNAEVREKRGTEDAMVPGDRLFIPGASVPDDATPVGEGDYVVKEGDCISSIAFETGHFWEKVWNDPGNAKLKEIRKNPNVLLPGDRVTIPEVTPKQEPGETEMRHRFVRRGVPEVLRVRFEDEEKKPYVSKAYVIEIDGEAREGYTNGDGLLEQPISPDAKTAKITFPELNEEYEFDLGKLEPIESLKGVQARLNNLGFACGEATGEWDERTARAVRHYQVAYELDNQSGELDDDTRAHIHKRHGS